MEPISSKKRTKPKHPQSHARWPREVWRHKQKACGHAFAMVPPVCSETHQKVREGQVKVGHFTTHKRGPYLLNDCEHLNLFCRSCCALRHRASNDAIEICHVLGGDNISKKSPPDRTNKENDFSTGTVICSPSHELSIYYSRLSGLHRAPLESYSTVVNTLPGIPCRDWPLLCRRGSI